MADNKITLVNAICMACLILLTYGCFGVTEIGTPNFREITHGYYFVSTISATSIMKCGSTIRVHKCITIVDFTVFDIDWNDKFIVVKRIELANPTNQSWYIINAVENRLYGPFDYQEYIQKREILSVPSELEFLRPEEKKWEAFDRNHEIQPE